VPWFLGPNRVFGRIILFGISEPEIFGGAACKLHWVNPIALDDAQLAPIAALHNSAAAQVARIYGHRGADPRLRDWREHGDLQLDQYGAFKPVDGPKA